MENLKKLTFSFALATPKSEQSPSYRLIINEQTKAVEDVLDLTFKGLANTWEMNDNGIKFNPWSFSQEVIDKYILTGSLMFNHLTDALPVGRITAAGIAPEGMIVEGRISNAPGFRDLRVLIYEGNVSKMSTHVLASQDSSGNWVVAEWVETSVVGIPADKAASMILNARQIKSDLQPEETIKANENVTSIDIPATPEKLVPEISDCGIVAEAGVVESVEDKEKENQLPENQENSEVFTAMEQKELEAKMEAQEKELKELKESLAKPVTSVAPAIVSQLGEKEGLVNRLKNAFRDAKNGKTVEITSASVLDGGTNTGAELLKTQYDEMYEGIVKESVVLPLLRTKVVNGANSLTVGAFTTGVTVEAGTAAMKSGTSNAPATDATVIPLVPFVADAIVYDNQLQSNPNLVNDVIADMQKQFAISLEKAVVNGDAQSTASAHMDYGITPAVGTVDIQFNGLRKLGTPLGRTLVSGGSNIANINTLLDDMKGYALGMERKNAVVLVSAFGTLNADLLSKQLIPGLVNLADVFGGINGVKYSHAIPTTLDTDGYYNSGSGTVQTKTVVVTFNGQHFGLGITPTKIEVLRIAHGYQISGMLMAGFAPLVTPSAAKPLVVVGFNVA